MDIFNNLNPRYRGLADTTVSAFLVALINLLFVIAAVIAFIFIIWGGFKWISSGGEKESLGNAKKTLTHALIGLVVVFSIYAFLALAGSFFGVYLLNFTIPTVH